jgi:ubiquinone/menaquinone biosynthesis C-methylase UbiE
MRRVLKSAGIQNVDLVLGAVDDPRLEPASIDLILMVDVYHELEYPVEMVHQLTRALKPGGRIVLVEYRLEDESIPIKELHRMSRKQAIREMRSMGLRLVRSFDGLPRQHVLFFGRASESVPTTAPAAEQRR